MRRFVMAVTFDGMAPVRQLFWRQHSFRDFMLESPCGIGPLSALLFNLSDFNEVRFPSVGGKGPGSEGANAHKAERERMSGLCQRVEDEIVKILPFVPDLTDRCRRAIS